MFNLLTPSDLLNITKVLRNVPLFGSYDPFGLTGLISSALRSFDNVFQGFVIDYNPNTHSALVEIPDADGQWPCSIANERLSYAYGFSETFPIQTGEIVYVRKDQGTRSGKIIGRLGLETNFQANGDLYNDQRQYHRRLFTQLDDSSDLRIPSMMAALQDPNNNSSHIATHFRPTDIYPGEFANVNQHNCGIKGGLFSATLLGGGAQLRMSALTNAARLSCDSYMRFSMSGNMREFHNGRFLSTERTVSMYQEERLGGSVPKAHVWTKDAEAPSGGENQTIKPRLKELSGFFGHISSKFALRPDPDDTDIRVQGKSSPKEEGVSRETIDPSGQYRLSASGMIAIERTGRIPVPVRKCYPTDNGHDGPENLEEIKLTPFKHDEDPACRQLELYDRQAYDLKNQYARVDGLGFEKKSDYDVPEEADLNPLQDQYDAKFSGSETVKLNKYDKRRAGMYIGEDGSVIIRDAWGSEITMLGGNVTIACAGNVMVLPGQTALTIAGDDIIQKAQNSVDIHASAHDVRLSAARNMEILGGGDGSFGGVIIESRGKGDGPWDGTGKSSGEQTNVSGITLRAPEQAVTLYSKQLNLRSREKTRIISGGDSINGDIGIAAKSISSVSELNIISGMKCSDKSVDNIISKIDSGLDNSRSVSGGFSLGGNASQFIVSAQSVMTASRSIGLFAESSLAATKGDKFPVPFEWVKVENIYSIIQENLDNLKKLYTTEKGISGDFDSEALQKMIFGFRSPKEYGTDHKWFIGGNGKNVFKMYQPAWSQVMNIFETLKGVESKLYKENVVTTNGLPFPGLDSKAIYSSLEKGPYNLIDGGINNRRTDVQDHSEIKEGPFADSYVIRK